jgi:hypothetical protein
MSKRAQAPNHIALSRVLSIFAGIDLKRNSKNSLRIGQILVFKRKSARWASISVFPAPGPAVKADCLLYFLLPVKHLAQGSNYLQASILHGDHSGSSASNTLTRSARRL